MRKWKTAVRVSLAFCLLAGGTVHGQAVSAQTVLDAKAIASDPRLKTPVTLDADRMYLGEALEKITAQTGVSVSIPATDPASGIPITFHIKSVPLADVMTSLWSLVGYSQATWQVDTEVQHSPRSYRLLPTLASRNLPTHLQAEADQAAADLWKLFQKIAAVSPRERQAYIRPFTEAMFKDTEDFAKSYLQDSPVMNDFWSRVGIVTTELSTAQQEQLQQGARISLPISSLTPAHQEAMRPFINRGSVERDGVRTELPSNDRLIVYFSRDVVGSWHGLIRDLHIGAGTETAFMGTGTMTAMESGLKRHIAEGWILPGDARTAEAEARIVPKPAEFPAESIWRQAPALDLLLTRLADAQDVSYMGIVTDDVRAEIQLPIGNPAKQVLEDLNTRALLLHKWRNGVLLFNYSQWFYGDDALYPYSVVKQLRESRKRHKDGSPMTLAEITDVVITLNDTQMQRLGKEFYQVEANKSRRPLFTFYKRYPAILSDEGMAVDLNMLNLLQQLNLLPAQIKGENVERVRLLDDKAHSSSDRRIYHFQIRMRDQTQWRYLSGFFTMANPPAAVSNPQNEVP